MNSDEIAVNVREKLGVVGGTPSAQHDDLFELVRRLKQEGQAAVQDRQAQMDQADKIYRAFVVADDADKKASERGEPLKIVFPVSYAQIQATLAAIISTFTKKPFFELEGRGNSISHRNSKLMEIELDYQLDQSVWLIYFHQWLLDMLRYGFGKLDIGYERKMAYIRADNPLSQIPLLGKLFPQETDQQVVSYEGACFSIDDPKTVCFDSNVSIGEIQKGQYVLSHRTLSYNALRVEADEEDYFNLERIPKSKPEYSGSEADYRPARNASLMQNTPIKGGDLVELDIASVKLVPSDYELSPLNRQQIWQITMANDAVIIGARPSRFEHGQFPTAIIEYSPDLHAVTNEGMAATIDDLQNLVSWLLNSHIASVRKTIDNRFIVDPSLVEVSDFVQRRNIIRLKANAVGAMERAFKQIQVSDVTQAHVVDAARILEFIERTTGISEARQGLQTPTVRSATEIQAVNRLGSLRLKLLISLLFEQGLRPLGTQMIQNTQQFMSTSRFISVSGHLAQALQIRLEDLENGMLEVSKEDLAGSYSVSIMDAETPTDKIMIGNILKELVLGMVQNPAVVQMFQLRPDMIFRQMLTNFGITNLDDFMGVPDPQQAMMQQAMMQASAPGGRGVQATVMPDEMLMKEQQKGRVIPFTPQAGGGGL